MNAGDGTRSRREWLKGVAAMAALPLLNRAASAAESSDWPVTSGRVHRVLDCNILLDLPETRPKPYGWPDHRRDVCMQVIRNHNPDIVCLQEVGAGQNQDFIKAFPEMVVYGYADPYVDTNPPRFQSIKNVVMFRRERYDLVSAGTYWYSLTPEVAGSRYPEVPLPRHTTWVRLKDKGTGREFRVMSTHWDLLEDHRVIEAGIAVQEAAPYSPTFPQLFCGDFNSPRKTPEHAVLEDAGWFDTYEVLHGQGEPGFTGHGYDFSPDAKRTGKIDFIFFHGNVNPVRAEIIRDKINGLLPSDHYFVSADVEL